MTGLTVAVVVALCVVVAAGLLVQLLGLPRWGVERYTISVDDLPNVAAESRDDDQPAERRAAA